MARPQLEFTDQIGVMGFFSRRAPWPRSWPSTNDRPELEGKGLHPEFSSKVQAALIHGNRYDYLKVEAADPMYKRFEKAWGTRDQNADRWAQHGAAPYLTKTPPLCSSTPATPNPKDNQEQLALFDSELTAAGVEHV